MAGLQPLLSRAGVADDTARQLRCGDERKAGFDRSGFSDALLASGFRQTTNIYGEAKARTVETGGLSVGVAAEVHIHDLSPEQAFDEAIARPLRSLNSHDVPLIVLVDGLDEALAIEGSNLVRLLSRVLRSESMLPDYCRFVLTARSNDPRITDALGEPDLDLVEDCPHNLEEIFEYAQGRLSEITEPTRSQLARRIEQQASGNFLYAFHVLNDVLSRSGVDLDSGEASLPQDLTGLYQSFLRRELAPDRSDRDWNETYRPALGLICVALGQGLELRDIMGAAALSESAARRVLDACGQFLSSPTAEGPFRIYHESFREFLRSQRSPCFVYPNEAEQSLLDYFVRTAPPANSSGQRDWSQRHYAEAHLSTHASRLGRLREVLLDLGLLAYAEPLAVRNALLATEPRSSLAVVYQAALPALLQEDPSGRALTLLLMATQAGESDLTSELIQSLPRAAARLAWAALDAEPPSIWFRPSLEVRELAATNIDGHVHIAGVQDLDDRVWIWEPETAEETGLDIRYNPGQTTLRFISFKGRSALLVLNPLISIADTRSGVVSYRRGVIGKVAVLDLDDQTLIVEAHPAGGDIWVRSLDAPDLWDHEGLTIRPSAAQQATNPAATLPSTVQHLEQRAPGSTQLVAVTDSDDLYVLNALSSSEEPPHLLVKVDGGCSPPFSISGRGDFLAVATADAGIRILNLESETVVDDISIDAMNVVIGAEPSPLRGISFLEEGDTLSVVAIFANGTFAEWTPNAGRIRAFYARGGRSYSTLGRGEETFNIIGSQDGLRVWQSPEPFAELPLGDLGPVNVITAADLDGRKLVCWVAAGPSSYVLHIWSEGGRRLDRELLAGSSIDAVMLGFVDKRPVAIALIRDRGYGRWLDTPTRIFDLNLTPSLELSDWNFDLRSYSLIQDDIAQHELPMRLLSLTLSSGLGQKYACRVVVSSSNRVGVVQDDILGLSLRIIHLADGRSLELPPITELGDEYTVGNLAIWEEDNFVIVGAVLRGGVANRTVAVCRVTEGVAGPWEESREGGWVSGIPSNNERQ